MYCIGNEGTAKLTDIARNCVWPMLRNSWAGLPLEELAAVNNDKALAAEATLPSCFTCVLPGEVTCARTSTP
jgi:hypothetical protein